MLTMIRAARRTARVVGLEPHQCIWDSNWPLTMLMSTTSAAAMPGDTTCQELKIVNVPSVGAAAAQLRSSSLERRNHRDLDCRHPLELRRVLNDDEAVRNDLAYCLSFAVDDSDFLRNLPQLFAENPRMQRQLDISRNQLSKIRAAADRNGRSSCTTTTTRSNDNDARLPRTVRDALRPTRRATVITETSAPFRIVDVNAAWENLCGYTFVESKGRTLGSLLKGPETDPVAATALIAKLVQGEEAGTTLVNYTKSGRRFHNRIRVGPLYDDDVDVGGDGAIGNETNYDAGSIKYFVGILQEVHGSP